MPRLLTLVLTLALAGIAAAGTPFGGDDTGFVPADKSAYRCASRVTKALAKLRLSITSCHIRMANEGLRGTATDDELCENLAKEKFDASIAKVASGSCPACLVTATAGLSDAVEAEQDAGNGDFYCAGTHAFPGDNTGFEPINELYYDGSSMTARGIAKLGSCITKCHNRLALYSLNGRSFDEEACEDLCRSKFDLLVPTITAHAPFCLQLAEVTQLADDTETSLDQELGDYYCE
jgi:hypothetical protein